MGNFMSNTYDHVSNQPLDVDRHWSKVVIALTSIHHKWYQLGTHLDIPNGTLESISTTHNNDHFRQMTALISTWIRRPTPDHHPSRRVLCVALANMGEVALADKIAGVKDEDQSSIGSNDPHVTASELKKSFDELLEFMTKEIAHVDINVLRLKITQYFKDDAKGKVDSIIEQYLAKIDEQYKTPIAILNSFIRSDFIGYINYSLIKVFQSVAKSQLLDLHIKKYEEQYQSFLNITFKDYIQVFQHHPDLRPDYPAGIPQFSFYLGSKWNGKTMITLKEVLQHCLPAGSSNLGFIHQLMITRIEQNCIIIAFAVLPHIAREVLKYLTNDDVIESMKKEGISVNISEQLMKYKESENGLTSLGFEIGHNNPQESLKQLTLERDEDKEQLKEIEQLLTDEIDVSTQTDYHQLKSTPQDSSEFKAKSKFFQISQHFLSVDDFNKVSLVCQSVSPQWKKLAKHLNVGVGIVESIEVLRGGRDTVWCLDELLRAWLRQTSESQLKPSWRILCDAIANIDRPLAENIWAKLHRSRPTPVATAVLQNDPKLSAKELSAKELRSLFKEILVFTSTEIEHVNVDALRLHIGKFLICEEELNDEIDRHLMRLEHFPTPVAILSYFVRHGFIGYINYSLIKVFQELAKSPLLDKRIEEYEKEYHSFLELALSQRHDAFQRCPDLRPHYPAGIPNFTIHLKSEYDGRSVYTLTLKDYLKRCFTNNDSLDQLLIAKISRN